jgi:2-polyprenyl-3-methyl-5-hydroxy-6-metoxy-1,4-benzoquinol methylase
MAGRGAMSAQEVVAASRLQPRYVEEWLNGMTAAGYLDYDPVALTYSLPPEHAYLLASEGTDHFVGGLFAFAPLLLAKSGDVAEAFKSGGGVPFDAYGAAGVDAIDQMNAGMYEHRAGTAWLQHLPEVTARLSSGGRVLDVGCGVGRVAMAIAKAYPAAEVTGLDPDPRTIERARATAAACGAQGRLRFVAATTDSLDRGERFDLITACDCVHDFSAPEATLASMRRLLADDGTLFVIEPKLADRLEDNINPIGAMFYGISLFHCMTQSLAAGGPGLGACLGPGRTIDLLRRAGFSRIEPVPIKSLTNLFYAARP